MFSRIVSPEADDSSIRSRAIRPTPAAIATAGLVSDKRRAVEANLAAMGERAKQRAPDALLSGAAQADEADDFGLGDVEVDGTGALDRQAAHRYARRGRLPPAATPRIFRAPCRRSATPVLPDWCRRRAVRQPKRRRATPRFDRRSRTLRPDDARRRSSRRRAPSAAAGRRTGDGPHWPAARRTARRAPGRRPAR